MIETTLPVVAILIGRNHYRRMLSEAAWDKLRRMARIIEHEGSEPAQHADLLHLLSDADACLTSWGVAPLDAEVLAAAPRLMMMAHMGSSVKRFVSDAVWQRGMRVTSAGLVLAEDVAVTTVGLMIVGMKRVWPLAQNFRAGGWRERVPGGPSDHVPIWPARELRNKVVGIVGASRVGRHVIRLLQPFHTHIVLYDPFLSPEECETMGAEKVELDELLTHCDILSLHAPSVPATHHMIDARRLALLKDDALLINTARGDLIDEAALIVELSKGRLFAFLDVTDPEPPAPDSPLRRLENVVVIPHIAGCIEDCTHMGDVAVEEVRRFFAGEPALYPVTPDMLPRMS
ncbi:MAG: hydroxyacid dehydrogenase [Anaerolineae bacterium]|nr:hydroxyacid dehydrogenase [Thermoflexales bacterium]MDW8407004.1 hydroxyacid dehydrogenase [Anaerolineae bacterium]